jgi:hypothetical protein
MSAERTRRYWLSSHVSFCRTDDYVVLLDTKANRYMGVASDEFDALTDHIVGLQSGNVASPLPQSDVLRFVEDLVTRGILTAERSKGRVAAPVSIEPPRTTLIDGYVDVEGPIRARDGGRFIAALATTKYLLRWRTFEHIIERIRSRSGTRHENRDLAAIRNQVALFQKLAPFFINRTDSCVFSTLALGDFLHRYQLYPGYVFGVRTLPFCAHCWLQMGSVVINDTVENVGSYTPILAL